MTPPPASKAPAVENVTDAPAAEVLNALPQTALLEQLLAVAQAVPGFLYTTRIDADGNSTFPFASDGIEELIGLRPEDIRNNAALLRSRYHPDDLPGLMEHIGEAARTLAPFRYELRVLHPMRGLRWVDVRATPRRLPDGTIEAHGLVLDITERKRMESELLLREREYRTLADNLPAPIIRYDAQGRRRYLNPAAARFLRSDAEKLLGHPQDATAPASPGMFKLYRNAIAEVVTTQTPREVELSLDGLPENEQEHYSARFVPDIGPDGAVGVLAIGFDITALKRAEIELREREAFLGTLLDAIPIPVFFKNRQGRFLGFNQAFERFYGRTKDQLRGKTVFDIAPREFAEVYHAQDETLYASGSGVQQYDAPVKNARGELRDVVFHKALFADADGTPAGLIGAILDITERKAAEVEARTRYEEIAQLNSQLEENARGLEEQAVELEAAHEQIKSTEAWYRGILQSAPDGMLVINERGTITLVNTQLTRMFGYAESELIGQPLEILVPPDVRGRHPAMRAGFIEKMLVERKAYSVPNLRGCRKDGSEFDADISLSRLPETDFSEATICASIRDITQRKQADERLRQALDFSQGVIDAIPDILFEVDRGGRYLNVWTRNPDVLAAQKKALLGKTIHDVLTPEGAIAAMEAIRDADANGVSYGNLLRLPHPEGDRWYDHSLSRKSGATPSETSFIVLSRDVTARKKMEEALAEREREFRSLAENLPVPVFRYDRQLRRVYVNPFVTQQIRTSADALLGKTPEEIHVIGPLEAKLMRESIQRVFASGKQDDVEVKFVDANGIEHWYRMANVPESGPDGKVQYVLSIGNDETKRHELESELHRRAALEEQVSSLAQAVPGFLFLVRVEPDGSKHCFPYASEGVADLFGLRPEDIQNDAEVLRARYHPDDRERVREQVAESTRTLLPYSTEIRIDHPLKGERWVEIRGTPRRRADGATDVHGLMFDITDKKRMEAALTQREHEFRTLIENAKDVVVRYDRECRRVYMNPAWERVNGISAREAMGKSPGEISGKIKRQARELETTLRRVMESARSESIDLNWNDKSGKPVCFQMEATPEFDTAGRVVSVLTVSRDISERKRMEAAVRENETRYRQIFDNAQEGIALLDVTDDGDFITVEINAAFVRLTGVPREAVVGKRTMEVVPQPQASKVNAKYHRCLASGGVYEEEMELDLPVGIRTFYSTMVPVRGASGRFTRLITITRDITERKRMEEALVAREREFRTLVENTPDTVARFDRDFRRVYVNPALRALLGDDSGRLTGTTPAEVPGGAMGALTEKNLAEVFATGKDVEFDLTWPVIGGKEACSLIRLTPEFDSTGATQSVLAVGRDITELNAFRQRIHQMAFYDTLTSLPNRALFNDRLRQMITDASWHGQSAGVMMIDLDRFKAVNDTMGHAFGDELLRETAARLAACVRSYDTVARLGGDEFAVLLPDIREGTDMGRIASKMLAMFDEQFLLDGKEVFMSCSIGIALYPDDSIDAEDLLKYADSAMYFAKRSGRNGFRFYAKELTASANQRLTLESELRRAIERNELELYYQPKILLEDGTLIGSEALLRWENPSLGMVPPDQFIQVAEDTGLIVEIGKWVLREACLTATEWNSAGQPTHKVAINLSARQFQSGDLVETIALTLGETACRPEWIELEITESLLLDEDGKVLEMLNLLRSIGISIAIDDFGTGYSALSYLARFPIDTLKIDKSFINTVTTDSYRAELVRAILSIARCLGQQVVAEGVETAEQALFLTAHGCQIAQGYLYSKPLPKADAAKFPKRLSRWRF